jgi:hypothetical protein
MRDNVDHNAYRFVILTLDSHSAGPAQRASEKLSAAFPGLEIAIHAAAEWGESPDALLAAQQAVASARIGQALVSLGATVLLAWLVWIFADTAIQRALTSSACWAVHRTPLEHGAIPPVLLSREASIRLRQRPVHTPTL